jgi:hypothetical protein
MRARHRFCSLSRGAVCHHQNYIGGFLMKRLLCIVVLLIAAVVALGYYLDWFKISTGGTEDKTNISITIDKNKVQQDTEKAKEKTKEKAEELQNKVKEKTGK